MTSLPPGFNWAINDGGTRGPSAVATIASYGAAAGQPTLPSASMT
jgi:hypothetical protein